MIEVEPIALKLQAEQTVSVEDLVHSEGVSQFLAVENIYQASEERMRQIENGGQAVLVREMPYLPGAAVTRSEDE